MRKLTAFILILLFLPVAGAVAQEPQQPFLPYYWVRGTVTQNGAPVAERAIAFYVNWEDNQMVSTETDANGYYEINVYELNYYYGITIDFATTYKIGVPQGEDGWGAEATLTLDPNQGYVDMDVALAEGLGPVVEDEELAIVTETLPDGEVGQAYSANLEGSGGTEPYIWSISYGNLPSGLSLDSQTGVVSGTLAEDCQGEYDILWQLTDNVGSSVTKPISILVTSVHVGGPQIYLKLYLEGLYNNNDETQTPANVVAEIYTGADPAGATQVIDGHGEAFVSGVIDLDENGEGYNGVVDAQGGETLPDGDYYLVIKQKLPGVDEAGTNHLPIITNTQVTLINNANTTIDLTDDGAVNYVAAYTPAGLVNALQTLNNGSFALRAGNLSNDNAINVLDYSIWKGEVTVDGLVDPADPNSVISDVNGDDKINVIDYSFWKGTVLEFAPGNIPQTGDHIYAPGY